MPLVWQGTHKRTPPGVRENGHPSAERNRFGLGRLRSSRLGIASSLRFDFGPHGRQYTRFRSIEHRASICVALCRIIRAHGSADSLFTVALAKVNPVRVDLGRSNWLRQASLGTPDFSPRVAACCTWLHLVATIRKKNCQERCTYASSLRDFHAFLCGRSSLFHLVPRRSSYREKLEGASVKREISSGQREIQGAETGLWAVCVALCRINSDRSADSLFTVALAEVNLVRVESGRTDRLREVSPGTRDFDEVFHLVSACFTWFQLYGEKNRSGRAENLRFQLRGRTRSSASLPGTFHLRSGLRGFPRFPFHLVSPGCTYATLKHDKTRYF